VRKPAGGEKKPTGKWELNEDVRKGEGSVEDKESGLDPYPKERAKNGSGAKRVGGGGKKREQ